MKTQQSGFTLIELVMVIVILGILSAVAIPKFTNLSADALVASKAGMSGVVRSAMAIQYGVLKRSPTVLELAAALSPAGTAAVDGVKVDINGTLYTVPTFSADNCTGATTATSDPVACVGTIP